jgi:hypothetical protein
LPTIYHSRDGKKHSKLQTENLQKKNYFSDWGKKYGNFKIGSGIENRSSINFSPFFQVRFILSSNSPNPVGVSSMVLILKPPPSDGFSYYFVPFLLFPKKRKMVLEQMKVFKKQKRWFWERITSGKPKGG